MTYQPQFPEQPVKQITAVAKVSQRIKLAMINFPRFIRFP